MPELIIFTFGVLLVLLWQSVTRLRRRVGILEKEFHRQTNELEYISKYGINAKEPPPEQKKTDLPQEVETSEVSSAVVKERLAPQQTYGVKKRFLEEGTTQSPAPSSIPFVPIIGQKSQPLDTRGFERIEQDLSSKWMIWGGGLALALGGGFLVKYSIDAGLLGPSVRIFLGVLFGLTLALVGLFLARRNTNIEWLGDTPDYLPSALSAAGVFRLRTH